MLKKIKRWIQWTFKYQRMKMDSKFEFLIKYIKNRIK